MALRTPAQALAWAKARDKYSTGMCLQFVRRAYNITKTVNDAALAFSQTKHRRGTSSTPPKGVPVWWTGGSRGFGHVAISDGGGYVISTDSPTRGRVGRVHISKITNGWGQKYRGWTEDINGSRVYTAPKAAAYKPPSFPKGLAPRKSKPSAKALQKALKAAGYMSSSVVLANNYGPKTRAAVVRFHNANPSFKAKGVKSDPKIGPKGWAYLFTKAYGRK